MSGDFLAGMAASSRARSDLARTRTSERELRAQAADAAPAPKLALTGRFDLIAEVKLRSPAVGQLRGADENLAARVSGYAEAGAAAISVLTEPSRFDGSLTHLTQAAKALAGRIPVMRKDFLVDAYQVHEARVAGAGGVLIILRMLERSGLRALLDAAAQLGLFALLEAFDEQDLQLAGDLVREYGARSTLLVGINSRDLSTLKVVPGRLETLAPLMPVGVPRVAESGIASPSDAQHLVRCGYDLALVGSALMRASDPLQLARSMIDVGRAAAIPRCG
jgi:indole-3-glycerol phosphate synthase